MSQDAERQTASKRRRLDAAAAFRLGRVLESFIRRERPQAAKLAAKLVSQLAVGAVNQLRSVPSISPATLALALLLDHPGYSDVKIAKLAGCHRDTLQRCPRFRAAREMQKSGKDKYKGVTS